MTPSTIRSPRSPRPIISTLAFALPLIAIAYALPAQATATPYWIAYEANDFPENEGWTRIRADENGYGQGGADRRIENGVLILDSLRDPLIWDYYRIDRQIDPEPGEVFIAEWRLRISAGINQEDAGLDFARDALGILELMYTVDEMTSRRENWRHAITPNVFHTYRIESSDMVHYSLWIDGQYARDGEWDLISWNQSFALFGDIHRGGVSTSRSEWDYFRFGTVPEPSSMSYVAVMFLAVFLRRFRNA